MSRKNTSDTGDYILYLYPGAQVSYRRDFIFENTATGTAQVKTRVLYLCGTVNQSGEDGLGRWFDMKDRKL